VSETPDKNDIKAQLVQELGELREEIKHFENEKISDRKLKRYGLDTIAKGHLVQFQRYLEGLYCIVGYKSEDMAITRFVLSLRKTEVIKHDLAKKTLLRMQEIYLQI